MPTRKHALHDHARRDVPRIVSVAGGKITGYRAIAEEVGALRLEARFATSSTQIRCDILRRMAEIVGAFATPHMPGAPGRVERNPQSDTAQLFSAVRAHLAAVQPDVLVVFDTDHFATFFLDNMPTFAVGVASMTSGPGTDDWPDLTCNYDQVPLDEELGRHVHQFGIEHGFDLAATQEFTVDHSIIVPLHFLNAEDGQMKRPMVPVWVNGIAPPLPLARRCFALGEMVRQAIEAWPSNLQVGLVASGAISGDIGGPKAIDNQPFAWPDEAWVTNVVSRIKKGEIHELLNEATSERLRAAGNVSGEMLNWIALLGAANGRKPHFLEPELIDGIAYGAWSWD